MGASPRWFLISNYRSNVSVSGSLSSTILICSSTGRVLTTLEFGFSAVVGDNYVRFFSAVDILTKT